MNSEQPKLPDFWPLVWLLFMQPITLHHRLKACGIDEPDAPFFKLWFAKDETRTIKRQYVKQMLRLLLVLMPIATLVFSLFTLDLFILLGYPIDFERWALGVAVGVAFGVAFCVTFIPFFFRLPLYPLEWVLQLVGYLRQNHFNTPTLRFMPVFYHELSYLPHPFLAQHIILAAETEPDLAREAIKACGYSPGQRRAGETALAHLQAQELAQLARQHQFKQLLDLKGEWLPSLQGAAAPLQTISKMAGYLQAAKTTTIAYQRQPHLKNAQQQLNALNNQLLTETSPLARALTTTLPTWEQLLNQLRQQAQEQAAAQPIPNPFRAGNPLTPENGQEVFRGRDELVKRIETLLVDPHQMTSIALLGPRRCGKSSLLKMLPTMLPDAICVFFDLQDNPIDSVAGFFSALAKRTLEQAQRDRRVQLPPLPAGTPFEAGSQWLLSLEDQLATKQEQRILICIDEFERLEDLFPGQPRELLQLMGLFRATIQHRRYLRLLISGAAPFDELDSLWSDHFINLREIRIGYLDEPTAIDLLTCPSRDFPPQAISPAIAHAIFKRTGGQPMLLQMYGSNLVEYLNNHERQQAEMADLDIVEQQVLEEATYYFKNIVQNAPDNAQTVLLALAEHNTPQLDKRTRRWLKRRCLLTENDQLLTPVLGEWIREYW